MIHTFTGADWAVRHLAGGPVGPASRWAATSNVEVGQTTPLTGKNGENEGESYKEEEREGGSGTGEEPGALS